MSNKTGHDVRREIPEASELGGSPLKAGPQDWLCQTTGAVAT